MNYAYLNQELKYWGFSDHLFDITVIYIFLFTDAISVALYLVWIWGSFCENSNNIQDWKGVCAMKH